MLCINAARHTCTREMTTSRNVKGSCNSIKHQSISRQEYIMQALSVPAARAACVSAALDRAVLRSDNCSAL